VAAEDPREVSRRVDDVGRRVLEHPLGISRRAEHGPKLAECPADLVERVSPDVREGRAALGEEVDVGARVQDVNGLAWIGMGADEGGDPRIVDESEVVRHEPLAEKTRQLLQPTDVHGDRRDGDDDGHRRQQPCRQVPRDDAREKRERREQLDVVVRPVRAAEIEAREAHEEPKQRYPLGAEADRADCSRDEDDDQHAVQVAPGGRQRGDKIRNAQRRRLGRPGGGAHLVADDRGPIAPPAVRPAVRERRP
jgi:hypothetical protein